MSLAYTIVGILLAVVLLASAGGKLTKSKQIVDGLTSIGVPLGLFPFLAACEIAGAIGLIAGIWLAPLGLAAAIGVVLYFLLAVGAHLRKKDFKGAPNPGVLLLVAAVVLVLRIAA